MNRLRGIFCRFTVLGIVVAVGVSGAQARTIDIGPPDKTTWILDHADLVTTADTARIAEICTALLDDTSRPLYVVTIPDMASYDPASTDIERFAARLYQTWADDPGFSRVESWRSGILLLVSRDDRKARIELGSAWLGRYDGKCQRIMDHAIIPAFRRGDFSGGIFAGVTALDQLARDVDAAPTPVSAATTTSPAATAPSRALPAAPRPAPQHRAQQPVHMPPAIHHVTHRSMPAPGFGAGPVGLFLMFFLLAPVLAIVNMILGGGRNGGHYGRRRGRSCDDSHGWRHAHGSGFHFSDHRSTSGRSHGIGGSGIGSHRGGHSRAGGGGGASGSW